MICAGCTTEQPPGARFCQHCGRPQGVTCGQCGTLLPDDARFCSRCGTPRADVADAAAPRSPSRTADASAFPPAAAGSAVVAERRVCSVLFVDLVGFTPLSEARDPEEVRELLSRYFDVARTAVERHGGVVEKFIGDAVAAVWGTPVATEDDAERAVRAGLQLIDAVSVLGAEAGVAGLAARAGVVTGEVAVTLGAVGQGMVAGDAMNTAARVQSAAEPGALLVDAATRRLTAAAVGYRDAGERVLKGKAEPEQLWRATRVVGSVGGVQRVDGLEAGLVGRDAELRLVKELFHASAERRTPRLVVVAAAAGVGKSRLGWEFEKYIDGLARVIAWHRGRCLSYGEGVAFRALAEAVRQRLGIAEEDPTPAAAGKLADGLAGIVTEPAERDYVTARLARLLGVSSPEEAAAPLSREELFAGWRLFFERLAADAPVVLLIEDAQYADPGLLEFLEHLIDWARDLPIFVLVLTRPELEQRRAGFGVGRNRTLLTLDPLDAASMATLVEALVPGISTVAREAITRHAQGVPLFAVETVRSLVDRDIVQPVDGVYRLVGEVGELTVPDSLHALLAARLDALDPDVRTLLADAAVLGTNFPAEALVAVSGRPEESVRAGLAELLRREVLDISADPLSPQRGEYRFAQELLRQVAYDTLSRRDRKARHLAVAAHLRATFADDGEEVTDAIARHYRDALAAVPDDPDTDQIRQQATRMWVRAAERARHAGAPATAATAYATAAQLARPDNHDTSGDASSDTSAGGSEVAGWWESAAESALIAGDYDGALRDAERAQTLHSAAGRTRAAARAQALAGRSLRNAGQISAAHEHLTAALDTLRAEPDADTVTALQGLALLSGREDSERFSVEALNLSQGLDLGSARVAGLLATRGLVLAQRNRMMEAAAVLKYAADIAARAGDQLEHGHALMNLTDVLAGFDSPAAVEAALAAIDLLRRVGAGHYIPVAITNLCEVWLSSGEWDEVERELTTAIERDGLADDEFVQARRGDLAALRGEQATATAILAGLPRLRASEDGQDRAALLLLEAEVAYSAGDAATTLDRARQVVGYHADLGVRAETIRWAWPFAARAAHELRDYAAERGLLAVLDSYPPGHLALVSRAEADLARARLAADDAGSGAGGNSAGGNSAGSDEAGSDEAATLFVRAVAALRRIPAPYHLAHARLDQAGHLLATGEQVGAQDAVAEAGQIAERLRAEPLARRVRAAGARLTSAEAGRG